MTELKQIKDFYDDLKSLQELNDAERDLKNVCEAIIYISNNNLFDTNSYDSFIKHLTKKYKDTNIVNDYYRSTEDATNYISNYHSLIIIQDMICEYIKRKFGFDLLKNLIK